MLNIGDRAFMDVDSMDIGINNAGRLSCSNWSLDPLITEDCLRHETDSHYRVLIPISVYIYLYMWLFKPYFYVSLFTC